MITKANINGKLLTWARERANMEPIEVALLMGKSEEDILSWESGANTPTFKQAQKIADKLYIPFGYLFLSTPPIEEQVIPDLRRVSQMQRNNLSLNFKDVLNDAILKQDWYKEMLLQEGAPPLPFVGKYSIDDDVLTVAKDIRETLGINTKFRSSCRNWEEFLIKFIAACEDQGIIVLRNGVVQNNTHRKLSVKEFRGFALSDNMAPLIFINNTDAEAAKIFTVAHELAHIWIGESGVSNEDKGTPTNIPMPTIESFCNKVAAEILVPRNRFMDNWEKYENIDTNLYMLSKLFKVSELVILIRAKETGQINSKEFYSIYKRYSIRKTDPRDGSGGGNSMNTIPVRNSKLLTRALITSALEGKTLIRDAASILGLKNINTLDGLALNMGIR